MSDSSSSSDYEDQDSALILCQEPDDSIPICTDDEADDEEDIPTDEDRVGSLEDFIVNGDIEEDGDTTEEEEEMSYSDDDDKESDFSFDPACDSDDSYEPPVKVDVPAAPVRRSTRKRKARVTYVPEPSSDIEDKTDDEEEDTEDKTNCPH